MISSLKNLPVSLRVVSVIALIKGILMVLWAVNLMVVALMSREVSPYAASALGVFYIIVGLSLVFAVYGIFQAKRYARSLVIVWQLFAVIIGVQLAVIGYYPALLAIACGGIVIVLMFSKTALLHFEGNS